MSDSGALGAKFSSQSFCQIENVFHFGDVVLTREEWTKPFEVYLCAHAQLRIGFRHAVSDTTFFRQLTVQSMSSFGGRVPLAHWLSNDSP